MDNVGHASMEGGGRAAHRWTWVENTIRQGVVFFDPIDIIDDEMHVWNELWQRHDKIPAPVPDGVIWDSLAAPS